MRHQTIELSHGPTEHPPDWVRGNTMLIESDDQFRRSQEYVALLQNVLLEPRRAHTAKEYEFVKVGWLSHLKGAHNDFLRYLSDGTFGEMDPRDETNTSPGSGERIRTAEEYERTLGYIAGLQRLLLEMRETHTAEQYQHMSGSYLKELAKAQREVTFYLAMPSTSGREAA